ncbi:hypothetical protein SUGI_0874950 [Cryptomeria japonica]|uniref:uncharacterized protein LOC131049633 n=1 Tax=Cryptomeria japonica TaxID=3369 RepID=UPI0024149278|nr:uncharacterized protein LOC131049633 [Cryptomeria japonica]GLJ42266.1 hypothetical protein SUGI_0874950 [Cryptomeria japonica]
MEEKGTFREEMGSNGVFSNKRRLKRLLCSWACLWRIFLILSLLFYTQLLFSSDLLQWRHCDTTTGTAEETTAIIASSAKLTTDSTYSGDLCELQTAWNTLTFGSNPSPKHLKIALFVKKWPSRRKAAGLERHAQTLHRILAQRGHKVHVFTRLLQEPIEVLRDDKAMQFHFNNYSGPGKASSWSLFQKISKKVNGFDIIHSESVSLPDKYAKGLPNVVATWHGIAYEIIHSDIVQDLARDPVEPRSHTLERALKGRVGKVVEEIKFFPNYRHHIAISDYAGDVLRKIYMLPVENIHIILNGVDPKMFRPNPVRGQAFRALHNVPQNAQLVVGMAGRLVRDKGHPMVFRVLREMFMGNQNKNMFFLIAGDGPWASRYTELGSNIKVVGSLSSDQLGDFYNALDIFMNPTLRAQGLDLTLLEAMFCGKPLLATHFSSIIRSVVPSEEFGYTFSPTHESLKKGLERVLEDGKKVVKKKGRACRKRATLLFTAEKMASAYERLFLCIAKGHKNGTDLCKYPLNFD